MAWISTARSKVQDAYDRTVEQVKQETAGTQSKKEKAFLVGSLLKNKVSAKASEAHQAVARAANDAHDNRILHKQKSAFAEGSSAPIDSGIARIRVEVVAAADLQAPSVGSLDPYCKVTVGRQGVPWSVKVKSNPEARLPVALRQGHPRWEAACVLALPPEDCLSRSSSELTVRVMDARAVRQDTVLGEARVPLEFGESAGCRTVRLLGGGFASLSLRWFVLEAGQEDIGSLQNLEASHQELAAQQGLDTLLRKSPFEGACAFWNYHSSSDDDLMAERLEALALSMSCCPGQSLAVVDSERSLGATSSSAHGYPGDDRSGSKLAKALPIANRSMGVLAAGSDDRSGWNELLLQAPLIRVLGVDSGRCVAVLRAISNQLSCLEALARSRLVGALVARLQKGFSNEAFRARAEFMLHELLTTSEGDKLMELKKLIDTAGTGHNLLSMCAVLSTESLRASLLGHFCAQAVIIKARPVHVLSDIDMTVWVGVFGAGGPKFPKGPVPGALSLFEALGGRITFLSARPPLWESRTRGALLNDIGIAEANILQGTLQNVVRVLVQPEEAHRGMGEQKEKVFNQFAALHPEARFVFFGDSGEGDVDFSLAFVKGQPLAEFSSSPRAERVALIHDVVGADGVTPKTDLERRKMLDYAGVYVFDTYIGAAERLYRLGFLDEWSLRQLSQSCVDEFAQIPEDTFHSPEVFCARQAELRRDMQCANITLTTLDRVGPAANSAEPPPSKVSQRRNALAGCRKDSGNSSDEEPLIWT
ncbi:unnamed protein product [Polarella glacialis]|uniref:C2 domain-containing protein n=1 Tax=Polarella glacialis TaxID=89957 RepID=A0A813JCS1_POLGL|nr:unnamed protein product [Polarella glacialis]